MMLRFLAAAALAAAAVVPGHLLPDPPPAPPAPVPAAPVPAAAVRLVVHAVDATGRPVAFDGDVTISAAGAVGSTTVHIAPGGSEQVSVPLTSGRVAWPAQLAVG